MENIYGNIYYFRRLYAIGGTEQFLYEIAKKYNKYDVVVMYDQADNKQVQRLRKFVRCIKREKKTTYTCKRAFFNYNIEALDSIVSTENYYAFVAHANFQELNFKPNIFHPKINHWIAVSKFAAKQLTDFAKNYFNKDIDVEVCYNPLTLEPKEKVLRIVSASRLKDRFKGGERMFTMIEALDRYCAKTGRHYIWEIFCDTDVDPNSKNVVLMKPRLDVRPYIQDADIVVQLSNDLETYCYTTNEGWGYGKRCVTTPFSVNKEFDLPKGANFVVNFDMSNIDEIVRRMFEEPYEEFTYTPPATTWDKYIDKTKTTYTEEERLKNNIVRALRRFYDLEEDMRRKKGEEFNCTKARYKDLKEKGLVELIGVQQELVKDKKTKDLTKKEIVEGAKEQAKELLDK